MGGACCTPATTNDDNTCKVVEHMHCDALSYSAQEEGPYDHDPVNQMALAKWSRYSRAPAIGILEATSFVQFELGYDALERSCIVSPQHYLIRFSSCSEEWLKGETGFLTLRLVRSERVKDFVPVGQKIVNKKGQSVTLEGDFLQFQLLCDVKETSLPLRITSGPSRINPQTSELEMMRLDLGRCIRDIVTDRIRDPLRSGESLLRCRWWICLELLAFIGRDNGLDCSGLQVPGAPSLKWMICLVTPAGSTPVPSQVSSQELTEISLGSLDPLLSKQIASA